MKRWRISTEKWKLYKETEGSSGTRKYSKQDLEDVGSLQADTTEGGWMSLKTGGNCPNEAQKEKSEEMWGVRDLWDHMKVLHTGNWIPGGEK